MLVSKEFNHRVNMNCRFAKFPKWMSVMVGCLAVVPGLRAFTSADADEIFMAYNKVFYFTDGDRGFYRATTEGGKTWFWERAEQMEMVLDVYERTKDPNCLKQFSKLFNGFIADHGTNWSRNEFNDDIMWMVIACARGYEKTGDRTFREVARYNFDLCYARAWSTNLGGGLWWKTSNSSKNACVNGPAAIAACLLYRMLGDTNYLTKAESIYQWERAALFNEETGQVYDNMDQSGRVQQRAFTYNEGTFIGAANFLGHTNDAWLAADYTKNTLCRDGLMPFYGQTGDVSGFNGICARWLARFMTKRNLQDRYQSWLQANADAAWDNRRPNDNLSGAQLTQRTPPGLLESWACSSSVVMMQVVLPNGVVDKTLTSKISDGTNFGKSKRSPDTKSPVTH